MYILNELEKNQKLYERKKISNNGKLVMDSAVLSIKYIFDLAKEFKKEDEYERLVYLGMDVLCKRAKEGLNKLRENIIEMEEGGMSIHRKAVEDFFK